MIVYRIGRSKYAADLTGNGSKINGGRWNHAGVACIYAAESRALSVLEFTAHNSLEEIRRSLCITLYQIPEDNIFTCTPSALPGNWRDWPHPAETRDFGNVLLTRAEWLVLKIPSVIIPQEFDYLLNPVHRDFHLISEAKLTVEDFVYDVRLKS